MRFLSNIFRSLAVRIYRAGKEEFDKQSALQLQKRTVSGTDTRFYSGASIINLAGDPGKIRIGEHCQIQGLMMVYAYGGSITMGNHCSLSVNSRIISTTRITIGNRVLIAHNVNIIDNNSHPLDADLRHQDFLESYTIGMQPHDLNAKPIVIEDDVWIGYNVSVKKGVTIGEGAIIGSDSVVTHDVPAWTINIGNPLRCIKQLEPRSTSKQP
jgi:maltose O-acetyltransferase